MADTATTTSQSWLTRHRRRLAEVGIGHFLYATFSWFFDNVLYVYVIYRLGLLAGGAIMTFLSLIVCAATLLLYERMRLDWVGAGSLARLSYIPNPSWWQRIILYASRRGGVFIFFALCVFQDPFITTAYFRQGRFDVSVRATGGYCLRAFSSPTSTGRSVPAQWSLSSSAHGNGSFIRDPMINRLARLYTPLEDAVSQLHSRRLTPAAQPSNALELHLSSRPFAVLFRNVATPNFELLRFASLAAAAGLTPLVIEFHRDKFVTRNLSKYALVRMGFYLGTDRNGDSRFCYLRVAHPRTADGLPFQRMNTLWGQRLIDFHHEILSAFPSLPPIEFYDASDWLLAHGPRARDYYADFFSLFIARAILFESFLLSTHEQQFTSEIVLPAFDSAYSRFGFRPLICRLDPLDTEGDSHWLQYPLELQPLVMNRLSPKLL